MQANCKVKAEPEKDFIELETHNILQLCDSHWEYGQIYRRFKKMIEDKSHGGISIFDNAHVDHNGILAAIGDLGKNQSLAKYGKTKSFRYYTHLPKQIDEFEALGKQLGWKTAQKYVKYKDHSCTMALIIGKGAE